MKKKVISLGAILTVLATSVLLGSCAWHRFKNMPPEEKAEMILSRAEKELDLTADQANRFNLIKTEIVEKIRENGKDRGGRIDAIIALVKKDKLERSDLEKIADEQRKKMDELRPFIIDRALEIHTILTGEQKEKIAEKIRAFHEKTHTDN